MTHRRTTVQFAKYWIFRQNVCQKWCQKWSENGFSFKTKKPSGFLKSRKNKKLKYLIFIQTPFSQIFSSFFGFSPLSEKYIVKFTAFFYEIEKVDDQPFTKCCRQTEASKFSRRVKPEFLPIELPQKTTEFFSISQVFFYSN